MKPVRLFYDLTIDVNCKQDELNQIYVDVEKLGHHIKRAIAEYMAQNDHLAAGKDNKFIDVGIEYNFDELIENEDDEE